LFFYIVYNPPSKWKSEPILKYYSVVHDTLNKWTNNSMRWDYSQRICDDIINYSFLTKAEYLLQTKSKLQPASITNYQYNPLVYNQLTTNIDSKQSAVVSSSLRNIQQHIPTTIHLSRSGYNDDDTSVTTSTTTFGTGVGSSSSSSFKRNLRAFATGNDDFMQSPQNRKQIPLLDHLSRSIKKGHQKLLEQQINLINHKYQNKSFKLLSSATPGYARFTQQMIDNMMKSQQFRYFWFKFSREDSYKWDLSEFSVAFPQTIEKISGI